MATYVVGFKEETDSDYLHGLKQLLAYDPDQIQMLYITPHRWTSYYRAAARRKVIQTDISNWDYKHQILAIQKVSPWRLFAWVKLIEAVMQLRPQSLWRLFTHPDRGIRAAMRWYYRIGRKVWFHEIWSFLFRDRHQKEGPALEDFWGESQDREQYAMERQHDRENSIYPARSQLLKEKQEVSP